MGLLYRIYQSVQDGHDRERDEADGRTGREDGASEIDIPVSLVHLLANPVGRVSGEQS